VKVFADFVNLPALSREGVYLDMDWFGLDWLDIAINVLALAIVPGVLAALGGALAAEAIPDKTRVPRIKGVFWLLFACGVVITFWQQFRIAQADFARETKETWNQAIVTRLLSHPPSPPEIAYLKTLTKLPLKVQSPALVQNAPGGINIGRDNAGTAIVNNNFGPAPLKISEEQRAQITAFLKANGITSGKVVIFVDGPTIETQTASTNLVKALKDAGIDAEKVELLMVPSSGTPIYPGISFDITPETYTLANEIGRALMASHVVNSPVPANQSSGLTALFITVRKP